MKKEVKKVLETLPNSPGVYEFLAFGGVIYVGKSKDLKQRVRSYFQPSQSWKKALRMVPHIENIRITKTDTHLEAQILECEKIIKYQPVFNNRMKSDRPLTYLHFDDERYKLRTGKEYKPGAIGPLGSSRSVYYLLEELKKLYPLQGIKDFQYHILPEGMTKKETQRNYHIVKEIFTKINSLEEFMKSCQDNMEKAAGALKFEEAGFYRDFLQKWKGPYDYLRQREIFEHRDYIFFYPIEKGEKAIYIRNGFILEKRRIKNREGITSWISKMKEKELSKNDSKYIKYYKDIIYREFLELEKSQILEL
ncbi:MAG: GIY-YIG nuclease family protein [Tissierellia bacterium]|nr:GIY-YIG nuclease family protein [Tissierellia bacterium]